MTEEEFLILYRQYKTEIESWDWDKLYIETVGNSGFDYFNESYGPMVGRAYIADIKDLAPSGKAWDYIDHSGVTEEEMDKDEIYFDTLDAIAFAHHMWIDSCEENNHELYTYVRLGGKP